MPSRNRFTPFAAATLALSLAACGSDSSTGPKSNLSTQEQQAVVTAVYQEISEAIANASVANKVPTNPAHFSTASAATTQTATLTAPCQLGGQIVSAATYTDNTSSTTGYGRVTYHATSDIQSCVVSTGSRNLPVSGHWTDDGYYDLAANNVFTFSWNFVGNLSWPGGACDVTYAATVPSSGNATVTADICGQHYSYSASNMRVPAALRHL